MSKAVYVDVLDAALAEVATATRLVLCSAEPANYAGIAAVLLASVTLTAGDGNGDFTIADGDSSGRKVTVGAQSAFSITATGTVTHIALDDGTDLQYVTTCSSQALTSGGTVAVGAWDIELAGNVIEASGGGGGAPAGTAIVIDWSTALGTSTSAREDGDKARPLSVLAGAGAFEVRSTSTDGLDFPSPNYMQVTAIDSQMVLGYQGSDSYYSLPDIGESVYMRFYWRYLNSGGSDDKHGDYFDDHYVTLPNWGPKCFGLYVPAHGASGDIHMWITAGSDQNPRYWEPSFGQWARNTTYRIELRFTRTGTLTYTLGGRVYNIAGTLLTDQWVNASGWGTYNDLDTFEFTTTLANLQGILGWQFGLESQDAASGVNKGLAGMLVTAGPGATWPGAYNPAVEPTWSPS